MCGPFRWVLGLFGPLLPKISTESRPTLLLLCFQFKLSIVFIVPPRALHFPMFRLPANPLAASSTRSSHQTDNLPLLWPGRPPILRFASANSQITNSSRLVRDFDRSPSSHDAISMLRRGTGQRASVVVSLGTWPSIVSFQPILPARLRSGGFS